ncbi:FkbM family methyltransferase, partial [Akkermansiaceae bacterium]|nr:FkbM family methyltransferase [Akkermansiaceae bacterium]
FKWQIGCRLVPGEVVFDWINGSKAVARLGETGMTGNVYCGLHEFPDMSFLLHTLRPEDVFIDIGANVGSYTILACSVVGAKGYCFEPIPSTYSRLLTNIKLNGMEDRVEAFNQGIGCEHGEMFFSSGQNCCNHALAQDEESDNKIMVEVVTLDEAVKRNPFMVKIDVEGFETPALQGASRILNNKELCVVIMELNGSGARYGFDEKAILEMMLALGFKTYSYNPFERKLYPLDGKNSAEGNTLFIRDYERVFRRFNSGPKINVHSAVI